MRPARIHFPSVLAGAGAVAVVLGLVSMMQAPSHLPPFQIQGIPKPAQMMRVVEGQPFTVPDGKVFVATGIAATGTTDLGKNLFIRFDGMDVLAANTQLTSGSSTAMFGAGPAIPQIPPGLVAGPGVVVSVFDPSGDLGVLLGYLADS